MRIVAAALVALGGTLALAPLAAAFLRRVGAYDHPNARSSHQQPTLRGGGLAPAVAMLVALLVTGRVDGRAPAYIGVTALAFAAIGLYEDLLGIQVFGRLGLQGLAALAAVPVVGLVGWPAWASVAVVLWLLAFVNAFNFMDGINGISCACTLVAGAAWWVVGRAADVDVLTVGGVVAAAAAAGFAPFNVARARLFLGDVGSYFLGAWLAVLAVLGAGSGAPPEAVAAPLVLYLGDTGTTIVRRVARGERWFEAHADHAYQRLVRTGWSHLRTTLVAGGAMAVAAALGMLSLTDSGTLRAAGDLGILAVTAGYLWLPDRISTRRPAPAVLDR